MRLLTFALLYFTFALTHAGAQQVSVADFGADPTGVNDSAKAFREAYKAVAAAGGGVVYIPSGAYRFTTTEDADPGAHVYIRRKNISFVGETPGPSFGAPTEDYTSTKGVSVFSSTTDIAVFRLGTSATGEPESVAANIRFENIRIDRLPTATGGGDGILMSDYRSRGEEITDVTLVNVIIRNQYNGLRALVHNNDLASTGRPANLRMSRCGFRSNRCHGASLEEFNEVFVSDCQFMNNECDGFVLQGRRDGEGTCYVTNSSFTGNHARGFSAEGLGGYQAADIHITGCQVDSNWLHGVILNGTKNVNISGTSITSNAGLGHNGEPNPPLIDYGYAGLLIWNSTAVSVSATTLQCNFGRGLFINTSTGVAVSGCVLRCNNHGLGSYEAMRIVGGSCISLAGLSFFGSEDGQNRGIYLLNNPFAVYGTGIVFDAGVIEAETVYGANVATGKFSLSYFDPAASQQRVRVFSMPPTP